MKVKIIACSDYLYWYRDMVGQIVEIVRDTGDYFWARESDGYINLLDKKDVEIINEQ